MKNLLIILAISAGTAFAAQPATPIPPTNYGKTADGTMIEQFTITNGRGFTAKVINYGAIITEMHVPDKSGKPVDVVLGFDDLKSYQEKNPYFGCVAGRVANRIAKGKFTL